MQNKKFGLLGRKLGHSWSPQIHGMLADYAYELYEVEPEGLADFFAGTDLDGMNVTIPYKRDAMAWCTELTDTARRMGCVNTLVRVPGGWRGDNTDYAGFRYLVESSGIPVAGKKALVFGSGGASLAVRTALADLGADPVVIVSRNGPDNYVNLNRHSDASVLVNATPLGMVPNTGAAPVSLADFPQCEGVFDVVYNPQRTAFLLEAERLGIPFANGLGMLVAQARRSAEQFADRAIPDEEVEYIISTLSRQMSNLILIGMPGSGKSAVGRALAKALGRPFLDADKEIERAAGMPIPAIFQAEGEAGFRRRETHVLARLGQGSGAVISTGGGCVTRQENYSLLHQNGVILWLRRDLEKLPTQGRPLSQKHTPQALYAQRKDLYDAFADLAVDNDGPLADTVSHILEALS